MSITASAEPPFSNVARQANKLMDQMQKGFYVYTGDTWTPNVNLYETGASYLVCVDLSGVDKEKLDVEVVDQRLKLRGTRAVPNYDDAVEHVPAPAAAHPPGEPPQPRRVRIHLMEIDHGPFTREVELPLDVNKEQIAANYHNGMLWIELPKAGGSRE